MTRPARPIQLRPTRRQTTTPEAVGGNAGADFFAPLFCPIQFAELIKSLPALADKAIALEYTQPTTKPGTVTVLHDIRLPDYQLASNPPAYDGDGATDLVIHNDTMSH